MKEDLAKALYKKAVGYTAKEVVEEYAGEDEQLVKRKISRKHVPPDVTALKTYLELKSAEDDLTRLTNEQLAAEKKRLLEELSKGSADTEVR